jgi:hypothetical protein
MDISFIVIFLFFPTPGDQHPKRGGTSQFPAGTIPRPG